MQLWKFLNLNVTRRTNFLVHDLYILHLPFYYNCYMCKVYIRFVYQTGKGIIPNLLLNSLDLEYSRSSVNTYWPSEWTHYIFLFFFYLYFFCFLRQLRLSSNSQSCLSHLSAGIYSMCHHTLLTFSYFLMPYFPKMVYNISLSQNKRNLPVSMKTSNKLRVNMLAADWKVRRWIEFWQLHWKAAELSGVLGQGTENPDA
jgi:hypothetical protein